MKHRFSGRREHGVSRSPLLSHLLSCRERKRFLAFARNDECGGSSILSPSPGGGIPKGRRLALAEGLKGIWGKRSLVSSSRAQSRDLFRLPYSFFLRRAVCMKHRSFGALGVRCFPFPVVPYTFLTANEKDFSLSLEMTNAGGVVFSLLPMEGGAPKGRRLASSGVDCHGREAFSLVTPSHLCYNT